jgi:protein-S-isoprenylcysteine O-methyltransferase Ste14
MRSTAINIISVCWMIFCAIWLIAAVSTKRSVYRESALQRLRYTIPILIGCFLVFRGNRMTYPLNARVIPPMDWIILAALSLCVAGLAFCLWARATLGRNWSGTITLKKEHELIVRGPYRIVRHPIYTGLLAMVTATVVVNGHLAGIIGALLVLVGLWIKLSNEEKLMLKQFPDQYTAYRQRVRRIVPYTF